MKIEFISSKDNSLFKEIRQLQATGPKGQKARFACGQALLEGIHLVQTWVGDPALKTLITSELGLQNPEIAQAVYDHVEICPETRVYQLDTGLWDLLSDLVNAPQLAGLLDLPPSALNPQKSVATLEGDVIILDRIQDAGNVGSILRTAAAAGFTQVIAISGCATYGQVKYCALAWAPIACWIFMKAGHLSKYLAQSLRLCWLLPLMASSIYLICPRY